MHYNWQSLFFSLLLSSLFDNNNNLVYGGPIRRSRVTGEDAIALIEGRGLNNKAKYVSQDLANDVKRQACEATAVAVPKNQLEAVLLQMQVMEQTILALINQYFQDGELDSSDPSGVFARDNVVSISSPLGTSVDVASLSSAASSILPAKTTVIAQASFKIPGQAAGVAASSTAVVSAVASSTVPISVAARSTTVTSAVASSTAPINVAASSTTTGSGGAAGTNSLSVAVSTATTGTAPKFVSGYTFNAQSPNNVAVYFGQTPVTGGTTLAAQCADPNVDIVILAFVISASKGGPYPQVNFGAACGGQTAEMISKAPGLLLCTKLATDVTTCQSKYGKKVFLSIGGASSQISFSSATSANTFATMLWNLFGPPGAVSNGLRPFGTAQIDGFDVDNEDNHVAYWPNFAQTMRTHFASTKQKTYYLSSAPQCPFPDASNPLPLLLLCDFVWVQFYNNPQCQIGAPLFATSVKQWSTALAKSTLPVKTRLYVGAPAFSAAGNTAYAAIGNAFGIEPIAASLKKLKLANFGGVMFWDGPEGALNTLGGYNIMAWAKAGLISN